MGIYHKIKGKIKHPEAYTPYTHYKRKWALIFLSTVSDTNFGQELPREWIGHGIQQQLFQPYRWQLDLYEAFFAGFNLTQITPQCFCVSSNWI
jgi:hypothetical protein